MFVIIMNSVVNTINSVPTTFDIMITMIRFSQQIFIVI